MGKPLPYSLWGMVKVGEGVRKGAFAVLYAVVFNSPDRNNFPLATATQGIVHNAVNDRSPARAG